MGESYAKPEHGRFRADQLQDGDRYALSNGHPVYCAPVASEHASRRLGRGWERENKGLHPAEGEDGQRRVAARATENHAG